MMRPELFSSDIANTYYDDSLYMEVTLLPVLCSSGIAFCEYDEYYISTMNPKSKMMMRPELFSSNIAITYYDDSLYNRTSAAAISLFETKKISIF